MKYIFKPSLYLGLFFILFGCGRKNDFGSKVDDNNIPIVLSEEKKTWSVSSFKKNFLRLSN
jgi:hypothetical protein